MAPQSSAMPMKLSGYTSPCSGWFQRTSASMPTSAPVLRSTFGW